MPQTRCGRAVLNAGFGLFKLMYPLRDADYANGAGAGLAGMGAGNVSETDIGESRPASAGPLAQGRRPPREAIDRLYLVAADVGVDGVFNSTRSYKPADEVTAWLKHS